MHCCIGSRLGPGRYQSILLDHLPYWSVKIYDTASGYSTVHTRVANLSIYCILVSKIRIDCLGTKRSKWEHRNPLQILKSQIHVNSIIVGVLLLHIPVGEYSTKVCLWHAGVLTHSGIKYTPILLHNRELQYIYSH